MIIVDVAKLNFVSKPAFPLISDATCPQLPTFETEEPFFTFLSPFSLVIKSSYSVSFSFHFYCQHPRSEHSQLLPRLF